MKTSRNRQRKNFRNVPPASHPVQFEDRTGVSRHFVEPPDHTQRRLEGRRSPGVEGPYWDPDQHSSGPGVVTPGDPERGIDYEIVLDQYGQEMIVPMSQSPYHPHPDYSDWDYNDPYYPPEDDGQPVIHIYAGASPQPPQMGLILSTVAIMLVVMGLAFFWLFGGEGMALVAARNAAGENSGSLPLIDPSAGGQLTSSGFGSSGELAPFFAPSVLYWEAQILEWATQHNLDPNMVATVMQIESCGDPLAVSRAGATGLFQVMPFHFTAGEDMFDPQTNALRGMNYLAERLIQTDGDVGRAFAGYNGGHVAAGGSWDSWHDETQRYFTWSTGIYDEAIRGLTTSETLNRWYEAGGRSLCAQAESRLNLE